MPENALSRNIKKWQSDIGSTSRIESIPKFNHF